MTVKHIVMTRFLSKQMGGKDILSDSTINCRLNLLTKNLIPSLNNQSCLDFEFVLLTNPQLEEGKLLRIKSTVHKENPKFKWTTIMHDKIDDYLGG